MVLLKEAYLRNVIFGFEDGFVSSAGALVGIAASSVEHRFVIIAGLVVIAVEATSMGLGAYLSEESAHQIHHGRSYDSTITDGILMWGAYCIAGSIALLPYVLITNTKTAMITSVFFVLCGLFLLGFVKGEIVKSNPIRNGVKMTVLAGMAVLVGFIVSHLGQYLLSR